MLRQFVIQTGLFLRKGEAVDDMLKRDRERGAPSTGGSRIGDVASAARRVMEWEGASKRYPGAEAPALDDVSFSVAPGEIVVLVGPNGSGKTTAMEMVSGLRSPTAGEVRVAGRRVRPSGEQRMVIGVQLQEAGLPQRLKVKEAISAAACLYDDPGPVAEIVAQLGLDAYVDSPVGSLSGGWARRLDVVLACIGRPRALVLDEPTSGIDPVARAELWEFLRRRRHEGVAVLASTHDLSEAEAYADRLLVLNRGRLVLQGPVEDVLGLAGGRWRLRLIGVAPDVDAWARRHDVELIGTGDTRLLVGSRDEVVRVGERVEAARERGGLGCQDVLRGPIRLEDVFTYAVTVGAASAVGTAGAAATSAEGRAAR